MKKVVPVNGNIGSSVEDAVVRRLVVSEAQAGILLGLPYRELLKAIWTAEYPIGIAELRAKLDVTERQVRYRLQHMVEQDLIEVLDVPQKIGPPVKGYVMRWDEFSIPPEYADDQTFEGLVLNELKEQQVLIGDSILKQMHVEFKERPPQLFLRKRDNAVGMDFVPNENQDEEVCVIITKQTVLRSEDVLKLNAEIEALVERYAEAAQGRSVSACERATYLTGWQLVRVL